VIDRKFKARTNDGYDKSKQMCGILAHLITNTFLLHGGLKMAKKKAKKKKATKKKK